MNPFSVLSGGSGGGWSFSGSSASSMDSKNQISSGTKSVGGINFAPRNSNLLPMVAIGAVALVGIYFLKKKA